MRNSVAVLVFVGLMALTGALSLRAHANVMPDCDAKASKTTANNFTSIAFDGFVQLEGETTSKFSFCVFKDAGTEGKVALCKIKGHEMLSHKEANLIVVLNEKCDRALVAYREEAAATP